MADIISFYAAARRFNKPAEPSHVASGPAQLLFFTGVRYERQETAAVEKKTRKRKVVVTHASDAALGS
ncbi:hypothetical protein [Agrobacterium larrymoorei]|uniref:Uncharacterized protein n=1 Tax=Agrobacterium larrymoorei TaxID=160699 RepID=A0A4D7DVV4_9HYPH|nr:hypothetical protein [Agrobacterium larrymoorei]QCI98372.1 hypothetical protein CFBP5473_10945 [Agrobacterium larrymoorei]QYA06169.1 hypothetical protein J5285_08780 [Agrobacterium larrymoorei]WHA40458.1 hypothetical protein CFBP5477_011540 [Agrobacterium larrymoorei]